MTAPRRKAPARAAKAAKAAKSAAPARPAAPKGGPPPAPKGGPPPAPAARPPRNDPRERLRRILFLVPYAVRHPGVPVKTLARRCGCSETEILEDLDFLLGVGSPPFAPDDFLDLYVEGERVYVALHQSFSRPPRFTESEAAALAAAARGLGGEGREGALKALRDSVPRDRRAAFDELVERIYAGAPPAPGSVLGRLQQAIAEKRAVRLAYHSASRAADSDRIVHPVTLAQRFGHWYLYGHDPARGKALAFRLDRIRACEVTDERFEPPSEADLAKARLFSEPTEAPPQVELGPEAVAWALARPGLRLVRRTEGGGAVVELPGAGEAYATRFALSLGGDAWVVSPTSARRHFTETVRRTLARYA